MESIVPEYIIAEVCKSSKTKSAIPKILDVFSRVDFPMKIRRHAEKILLLLGHFNGDKITVDEIVYQLSTGGMFTISDGPFEYYIVLYSNSFSPPSGTMLTDTTPVFVNDD